jgi:hypothetical protein
LGKKPLVVSQAEDRPAPSKFGKSGGGGSGGGGGYRGGRPSR